MKTTIRLLISVALVTTIAVAQTPVEQFAGIRQARPIKPSAGIESAAVTYIQSCESSTPLTGGAGGAPAGAIIEFRDLIASRPITVIHLGKSIKIIDKSGVSEQPPLDIVDISIIDIGQDQVRVFAYTSGFGNLIEFRRPSKDASDRLHALLKKIQEAQQAAASNGDKRP